MVEKAVEGDDPFEFVALRYPAAPGTDPDAEMSRCFVEEFAMMGMPRRQIRRLFESPAFAGTHAVLEARGAAFVDEIIASVFGETPASGVS
jgi:hypothetical protein